MKVTHAYRSFTMFGEVRRRPFKRPRISRIRFERNRRLGSADETPGRYQRKIFLLQNFRFGVRATPPGAVFRMLEDVDRATTSRSRITKNTTVQRFFLFFRN